MLRSTRYRVVLLMLLLALAGCAIAYFWHGRETLPGPGSPRYETYVEAFQVGVAAMDAGREDLGRKRLEEAVALVPEEPAGWANLGLLKLRKNDLDAAARDLKQAHALAPESGAIEALLGLLAERQGRLAEAIAHVRRALATGPRDLTTLFTLAEVVSQEGGPESEAEYQRLMEQILAVQPNNLPALTCRAGAAYRRKDMPAFRATLDRLDRLAPNWSARPRRTLQELRQKADMPGDLIPLLTELSNLLQAERGYSRDSAALQPQPGVVGAPLQQFLRLPSPRPTPAPPDRETRWSMEVPPDGKAAWDVTRVLWRLDESQRNEVLRAASQGGVTAPPARLFRPQFVHANGRTVVGAGKELPFPGGPNHVAPSAAGVLPFDWDNDLRVDLLLAGAGGVRFQHQNEDGTFADVTAKTGLPAEVLNGDYYAAWAADIEMDGDLDVILARRAGPPLLLRNNGDNTFTAVEVPAFAAVRDVRAFVWADLDNDGAPDPVFLDAAGQLHVFANERAGQFAAWPTLPTSDRLLALAVADVNDDGVFDLVALRADGSLWRYSDQDQRAAWQSAELARLTAAPAGDMTLFVEDWDNNGALDIIVAEPREASIFLADEVFQYASPSAIVPMRVSAILDVNDDGKLDLVGLNAEGLPVQALNGGTKPYASKTLRPLANPLGAGDNRINSFTVGGEIEIRAGQLVQKQLIHGPAVHFGLGEQKRVHVTRLLWTNGAPQWEFDLPAEPLIIAAQRLTGSCPFLYTDDGAGMAFAGDFMWNTPLGMYINAQATTGNFTQTTEWLKIPGSKLVPRAGLYELRVHANLWETDYFDGLALLVVDHPPGTEVYADERFFMTPTAPKLYITTPAQAVARAWDQRGEDVTDLIRAVDGRHLDHAGRGRYQGVTRDHWVEFELDDVPAKGPLYLVARGWLHPTDSSINVALSQGKHEPPRGLSLEVPDGQGGWKVALPALGFPAGKNKTALIPLDGLGRRFRLRTNLEIFWDFLGTAHGLDPALAKVQRPAPRSAELHYRGVTAMTQANPSVPEVPVYEQLIGGQPWRDLTGYYTRYGDVRELLARVDDRYVIMNAGDEIVLHYPASAGRPAGWQRDFLWESDGWTRDGNPNTRHGTTVVPLPAHAASAENKRPGALEDDPVYRRFPNDWKMYHTRYVTADTFARGLRTFRR